MRITRAAGKRIRSGGAAKLPTSAKVEAKKLALRTSKYRGVALHSNGRGWNAALWHEGKRQCLGCHRTEKMASDAYEQCLARLQAKGRKKSKNA